jgi:hypothetical protein
LKHLVPLEHRAAEGPITAPAGVVPTVSSPRQPRETEVGAPGA